MDKSINRNILNRSTVDFLLVLLLLVMSGNPIINRQDWAKSAIVIVGLLLFAILFRRVNKTFLQYFLQYLSVFIFIFIIQYINFHFISIPFVFGFIIKIFTGAIIFYVLGRRFNLVFFNVIFWISILSLPFYVFHMIVGDEIVSLIQSVTNTNSIGLYTFRPKGTELVLRNSGMFWEPGAFQGFINMCILVNLKNINMLWKVHRFKVQIIIFTLLTTQSTTGYLVFFFILFIYLFFYNRFHKFSRYILIVLFSVVAYLSFFSLSFLGDKVLSQYQDSFTSDLEYSNSRFGSFFFDLKYIEKNPFFGNGFHEKTRYADNPEIITAMKDNVNLGFSNGFSDFIASAGIIGMFWYLYFFVYVGNRKSRNHFIIFSVVIIFLLQGEPFLNFPFFLSFPFYSKFYLK